MVRRYSISLQSLDSLERRRPAGTVSHRAPSTTRVAAAGRGFQRGRRASAAAPRERSTACPGAVEGDLDQRNHTPIMPYLIPDARKRAEQRRSGICGAVGSNGPRCLVEHCPIRGLKLYTAKWHRITSVSRLNRRPPSAPRAGPHRRCASPMFPCARPCARWSGDSRRNRQCRVRAASRSTGPERRPCAAACSRPA